MILITGIVETFEETNSHYPKEKQEEHSNHDNIEDVGYALDQRLYGYLQAFILTDESQGSQHSQESQYLE
jgi:hypothetical protein